MRKLSFGLFFLLSIPSMAQLDSLFLREAQYGHFNGVVGVWEGNELNFKASHGMANAEDVVSEHTAFDIGSITKQFMAYGILQLVQATSISLDDPINDYLGAYADRKWKKVTIHHLLTHTSGIPSLFQTDQGLPLLFPNSEPIDRDRLIGHFKQGDLLFSPGAGFSYSNSGYVLIALIIENVSGLPAEEYLQANIFDRYGLDDSSCAPISNSAKPYYGYRRDLVESAPIYHKSWFLGGGGIYSSLADLRRWVQVLMTNDDLPSDLKSLLWKSHTQGGQDSYGYGWQIGTDGWIYHDGASAGFNSYLAFNKETGNVIIILTNRGFEDIYMFSQGTQKLYDWAKAIKRHLEGSNFEMLPAYEASSFHSGSYRFGECSINILRQDTVALVQGLDCSPSRAMVSSPLQGDQYDKMINIADAMMRGKYWRLAKYCNGEMKFVVYSGLFSIGVKPLKKQVGEVQAIIPYLQNEDYGLMRMVGTERILDIITYFNDEGKMVGLFQNGGKRLEGTTQMVAYPVGNDKLWLDGFPYGEDSAVLDISGAPKFIQYGRVLEGKRLN